MAKIDDTEFLKARRNDIEEQKIALSFGREKSFSGIRQMATIMDPLHVEPEEFNPDDFDDDILNEKIRIYTDNYNRIAGIKEYKKYNKKRKYPKGSAQVFNFIYKLDNDSISRMSNKDLQELLILIEKYNLEYRDTLGLDEDTTFGFEIEYENPRYKEINARLNEAGLIEYWEQGREDTLNFGAEIDSPVLTDDELSWEEFKKVCDILSPLAIITYDCGGHIHIGENILGSEKNLLRFIKLWATYENVINRFLYGEYLSNRKSLPKHARPLAQEIWDNIDIIKSKSDFENLVNIEDVKKPGQNAAAIYCKNKKNPKTLERANTIEFRTPNGSFNPIIWQNNLNLLVRLLEYAKSDRYDEDVLNRRHRINEGKYGNLSFYKEIFMDEALELADLIFDRNIDKVYFLRQYLKSYQRDNGYKKAVPFTK